VVIDTSDSATYTSLTDFPGKPVKYRGTLLCSALSGTVSVPAAAIAVLKAAQPTKMRISVFRDTFLPEAGGAINAVAGHGFVKYQTVGP
jgi:hypothetical protein